MRVNKILLGLSIILILSGCDALTGEEIGRLKINRISNAELIIEEITLDLKKDEKISFWTETDIEYNNDLKLFYTIELWKDSVKIGGFYLDALDTNPTLMNFKTTIRGKTSWTYTGKMDFMKIEEDGQYTCKAALNSSDNPSLKVNKAELVFKR